MDMARLVLGGGPLLIVTHVASRAVAKFLTDRDCVLVNPAAKKRLKNEEEGTDEALEEIIIAGCGVATTLELLVLMQDSIQNLTLSGLAAELLHAARFLRPGLHDKDVDTVAAYLPTAGLPLRPGAFEVSGDDIYELLKKTLGLRGCLFRLRGFNTSVSQSAPQIFENWAAFSEEVQSVQLPTSGTRSALKETLGALELSDDVLDELVVVSGSLDEAIEGLAHLRVAGALVEGADVLQLLEDYWWNEASLPEPPIAQTKTFKLDGTGAMNRKVHINKKGNKGKSSAPPRSRDAVVQYMQGAAEGKSVQRNMHALR
jgi:hypothetical protein